MVCWAQHANKKCQRPRLTPREKSRQQVNRRWLIPEGAGGPDIPAARCLYGIRTARAGHPDSLNDGQQLSREEWLSRFFSSDLSLPLARAFLFVEALIPPPRAGGLAGGFRSQSSCISACLGCFFLFLVIASEIVPRKSLVRENAPLDSEGRIFQFNLIMKHWSQFVHGFSDLLLFLADDKWILMDFYKYILSM